MRIISVTDGAESIISQAIATLKAGGLVVYPTETTYGIGADVESDVAVAKLLQYKGKRDGKALSVAVADQAMAERYVVLNDTAKNLYKVFLPGPVTVISTGKHITAPGVESMSGSLGIRIPKYDLILKLLRQFGRGITATGANASYMKRPYKVSDIFESISEKQKGLIDLVIDVGELPHADPSTVIDTTADDLQVLRVGEIHAKDVDEYVSNNEMETIEIAKQLMLKYRSKLTYQPLVFALTGEMGMGKTHFVKGLAAQLSISETITSPTYTLSQEHEFVHEQRAGIFAHIDTWRLNTPAEFAALEVEHLLAKNAVLAIEWADKVGDAISALSPQATVVWVEMSGGKSDQERRIRIIHP